MTSATKQPGQTQDPGTEASDSAPVGAREPSLPWEVELVELLGTLSGVQEEVLALLDRKRQMLVEADSAGLLALQDPEQQLISRLEACHQRRARLLDCAAGEGLPSDSLRSLATALEPAERRPVDEQVDRASNRLRLIRHQSLTNWVVAQRTLIHLSQILEIIATGGKGQPTYGRGAPAENAGALMDQAA